MRTFAVLSLTACLALAAGVRADDQAELRAVVEKAIKANGGEEKFTKFKATSVKFKGKFYGMGEGIPYDGVIQMQLPDKRRLQIDVEAGGQKVTFAQVFNGEKGWKVINGDATEMDKDAVAEAKHEMYVARLDTLVPLLKDKDLQLAPLGESKVEDKPAIGIRVSSKGHRDVSLYFDKSTGLLTKVETNVKDQDAGGQEFTQTSIYGDYKDVDGRKMPMKLIIKRDGKLFVDGEMTEVKVLEKLDDSTFAKP